jgi:hypothetical protein
MKRLLPFLLFVFVVPFCFTSAAVDKVWKESVSGDWQNPNNWIPAGVPAPEDNIRLSSGGIGLGGVITITGTMDWAGGVLGGGTLVIGPSGRLNLVGEADKLACVLVLKNAGALNWEAGRLINYGADHDQSSYITNLLSGVFRIHTDTNTAVMVSWGGYRLGSMVWHNEGTIIKEGPGGTNKLEGCAIVNAGLLELRNGALNLVHSLDNIGRIELAAGTGLLLNGRRIVLRAGSQLNAAAGTLVQYCAGQFVIEPGTVMSATTVNRVTGSISLEGTVNLPNLELVTGGGISGAFTNTGRLDWSGGILSGRVTIASGGELNLVGEGDKLACLLVLKNAGALNWEGGRLINYGADHDQSSYITNLLSGVFRIHTDTNTAVMVSWGGYRPGRMLFHNQGLFVKEAGSGMNVLNGMIVENNGIISVKTGAISFSGGLINHGEVRGDIGLKPLGWSSGQFKLLLTGTQGVHLAVYYSDDLLKWNLLLTTNSPGGTFEVADPQAPWATRRVFLCANITITTPPNAG